jgi:hypothetical protein
MPAKRPRGRYLFHKRTLKIVCLMNLEYDSASLPEQIFGRRRVLTENSRFEPRLDGFKIMKKRGPLRRKEIVLCITICSEPLDFKWLCARPECIPGW